MTTHGTEGARSPDATCANCADPLSVGQRFCARCGQKADTKRLTLHELGHELLHALVHVDRSVLTLVRALLFEPGRVAAGYVAGRRRRHIGPFAFLVVVVALTSAEIAASGFHAVTADVPNVVGDFLQRHVNLVFFAQIPLLALFNRLLAWSQRFNYSEHLVLAAYTGAIHILCYAVLVIPGWLLLRQDPALATHLYYVYLPLWPLYFGFANSQFLEGPRWWSALRGVMALLLSQGTTLLIVSMVTAAFERH